MLLKLTLLKKNVKSSRSGSDSVAAVFNQTGGCEVDVGGVGDDWTVAGVAVARLSEVRSLALPDLGPDWTDRQV